MPRSDRELAGVVGSFVSRDNAGVGTSRGRKGVGAGVVCGAAGVE